MIALDHVTFGYPGQSSPILNDVTARFSTKDRVGILAASGSGKSTVARLLSGVEQPQRGAISRRGRVSWPVGFAGFFHPELTAAENIAHVAGLSGAEPPDVVAFCMHFCDFPGGLSRRMLDLSPTERAVLGYSCSLAIGFDQLIVDETVTVGTPVQRMKCEALLNQHLETGGLIVIARTGRQMKQFCNKFMVLTNGQFVACKTPEEAEALLRFSTTEAEPIHV